MVFSVNQYTHTHTYRHIPTSPLAHLSFTVRVVRVVKSFVSLPSVWSYRENTKTMNCSPFSFVLLIHLISLPVLSDLLPLPFLLLPQFISRLSGSSLVSPAFFLSFHLIHSFRLFSSPSLFSPSFQSFSSPLDCPSLSSPPALSGLSDLLLFPVLAPLC